MHPKTPYYSYDANLLVRTLKEAKRASSLVANAHIHYAVKANHNPEILRIIASEGFGADCVSGGEIKEALQAGFNPEDIVYAGVGKTDEEIVMALSHGIGCFNVESIEELRIISSLATAAKAEARVALRINPDVGAHTHANITTGLAENKFGINADMVDRAVTEALTLPGIKLTGLHFHIGSQILDMGDFEALCDKINEYQDIFKERKISLSLINVGGGLGIDYDNPQKHQIPDFEAYFGTYASRLRLEPGQEFHCELGRAIVAQCGTLVSRCIYVKEGSFKKFVILDAGMNDLIRPALYDAHHKIENISNPDGPTERYDVVGPICESSDCFGKQVEMAQTKRGDLIAIRSAGAYGESMSSTYNSRPLAGCEIVGGR